MEFQWRPDAVREGPETPVQGLSGLDGDPSRGPYSGMGCAKALSAPAHSSARAASSQTMSIASWICFSSIVSAALFSGSRTSLTLTSLDPCWRYSSQTKRLDQLLFHSFARPRAGL